MSRPVLGAITGSVVHDLDEAFPVEAKVIGLVELDGTCKAITRKGLGASRNLRQTLKAPTHAHNAKTNAAVIFQCKVGLHPVPTGWHPKWDSVRESAIWGHLVKAGGFPCC